MTRTPLIAANWKLHGRSDWSSKPTELVGLLPDRDGVELLICPPFPYLAALANSHGVKIGGQTCSAHEEGAHTGEVAADMLRDVHCDYVIVGHSERRAGGETSADVNMKAHAAARAGLVPIICVGETLEQREAGDAVATVLEQLADSVPDGMTDYVVAYEPVWAIGTGKVATPDDIAQMHAEIRKVVGEGVRVLYGGSVKPANAHDVFKAGNVDGALIGGAGLEMESLAAIARIAMEVLG